MLRDLRIRNRVPDKPLTTRPEFEKVWRALRGAEEVPQVDFTKEFVVVETNDWRLKKIGLVVEGKKVWPSYAVQEPATKKIDSFGYAIAVFRREHVDVVSGRIVAKTPK